MAKFDRDVLAYYEQEREEERLTDHHPLERLRTQALLKRWLPPPPATVLDVGGGPGVHAAWLAGSGYRVRLFDPVPRHVAEASRLAQGRFGAELAEARSLPCESASADAVLLLGPSTTCQDATNASPPWLRRSASAGRAGWSPVPPSRPGRGCSTSSAG